ncbi:MAG TPA: DinB family protein [Planctomycetaceae bacterium]|nr:DinB family protein [Planctomycetaceae bacterium]
MAEVLRNQLLAAFDFTDKSVEDLFDAIPADKFLHQPCPGANHALWTLGHLATVNQYFMMKLGGRDGTLFEKNKAMFFAKSQPSPDAATYPPIGVIRDYFTTSRAAFRSWVESLSDEQLSAPPPEEFQKFAPTLGNILMRLLWHEGMHYGQLTVIRKSLGLKPVRI